MKREHTIRAHFKVENDDGTHQYFADHASFVNRGGTIGVFATLHYNLPQDYAIVIKQIEETARTGYHLVEASGMQSDPPDFFPCLLMKTATGKLSYHYLKLPAGAGTVHFS